MKPNGPFRGLMFALPVGLLIWAAIISAAVALASKSDAAPLCEVRSSAHIAEYGGLWKDSAEHVARGELPTCDPNPDAAQQGGGQEEDTKSRYCRKHWYC